MHNPWRSCAPQALLATVSSPALLRAQDFLRTSISGGFPSARALHVCSAPGIACPCIAGTNPCSREPTARWARRRRTTSQPEAYKKRFWRGKQTIVKDQGRVCGALAGLRELFSWLTIQFCSLQVVRAQAPSSGSAPAGHTPGRSDCGDHCGRSLPGLESPRNRSFNANACIEYRILDLYCIKFHRVSESHKVQRGPAGAAASISTAGRRAGEIGLERPWTPGAAGPPSG